MKARKIVLCLCTFALWLQTQAVLAQRNAAEYQPAPNLTAAIRKAKIINETYPLRVGSSGTEVLVTTLNNPKSDEKSLKIDAVLVAKAIMDADKKILIVHYRTKESMTARQMLTIIVKQSDVMAYGVNAIGVDSLLGELKVVKRTSRGPHDFADK